MLSFLNLRKSVTIFKRIKNSIHDYLIERNKDLYEIENKFIECRYVSTDYIDLHFNVIAIEDRRFFFHYGVDVRSTIRNIIKMMTLRNHGGASTIEMQLVRTITKQKERKFSRKINEMILAIAVNRRYTKLEIINCYLNYAYFGAYMNGIHESMYYMYKKYYAEDLNIQESSIIAAMLQQPRPKEPSPERELSLINRAANTQRRSIKIKESFKKNKITREW